ncbi:MAG: hypothetical protein EA339_07410 [Rhodobacteraceae bacterium]|nr:MAG: hypothetical protein EA339_07410 [Paracoccaceae bacterium]
MVTIQLHILGQEIRAMFAHTITLAPPLRRPRARKPDALQGFARDTRIATITGPRPIERIMAGDLVLDTKGQIVELRGIRKATAAIGDLVQLRAGSDEMRPERDLTVGAGQKLGLRDWRSDLIFGKPCLIASRNMVDGQSVRSISATGLLYQLIFDTDVVIVANGLAALVKQSAH